jgi:hypothetical protein
MAAAGWYPDPRGRHEHRYFDGTAWTDHVADGGRPSTDPVDAPAEPSRSAPASSGFGTTPFPRRRPTRPKRTITEVGQYSTASRVAVFAGAALLVVGAFLPWVEASVGFLSVTNNGIDGDGAFTLACGIGAGVLFWLVVSNAGRLITLLAGAFSLLVAIYDITDINGKADELSSASGVFQVEASVGIGLWITAIAAIAVIVGAVLAMRESA